MPVRQRRESRCADLIRLRRIHYLSMWDVLCRPSLCVLLIVKLGMYRPCEHQPLDLRSTFINFGGALIAIKTLDERRFHETFPPKYLYADIDCVMSSLAAEQLCLGADERDILTGIETAGGLVCKHSTCG